MPCRSSHLVHVQAVNACGGIYEVVACLVQAWQIAAVFDVAAMPSGPNKDGCLVNRASGESAIYVEEKSSFTSPPLTECTLKACHFIVASRECG